MVLGYEIQRFSKSDKIIVRDPNTRTPCLEILSDTSPFSTSLYKGRSWDYLCITESTLYLELMNIQADTVFVTPLVKELVDQEKILCNKLGTVLQNVSDLAKDYGTEIFYNNIGNDRISTILDAYNRGPNSKRLILGVPLLTKDLLDGEIYTSKDVLIVANTEAIEDKEVLKKLGINTIKTDIKSIPLGIEIANRRLKVVFTKERVTPSFTLSINHLINNINK